MSDLVRYSSTFSVFSMESNSLSDELENFHMKKEEKEKENILPNYSSHFPTTHKTWLFFQSFFNFYYQTVPKYFVNYRTIIIGEMFVVSHKKIISKLNCY